MGQQKGGEEDTPDHLLERVPEGEATGSNWKVRRGKYYATASLFEDGKPKTFSLFRGRKKNSITTCDIDIFSDELLRHRETFTLKSKGRVKFTSVFKLDLENEKENASNTLPHYFNISPYLEPVGDRWWSFKTEFSSFIFRRNLETILSHAMPLPRVGGETYQPYVLHNHDLINTCQTWSSSLDQAFYLLEFDKVLQQKDTADQETKSHYRKRIAEVIFGYFVWVLQHAARTGFHETVILHWSGKLAPLTKKDKTGEVVGEGKREKGKEVLSRLTEKSSESEVAEPLEPVAAPRTKIDSTGFEVDSGLSVGAPGSTTGLKKASTSDPGKTQESADSPPLSPFEPELSKYEDKFRNCCRFLDLLDMCLTNYLDEKPLITRMVEAFLKLAWEPIEMSKHRGSHLWPDRLDILEASPSPRAQSQDLGYDVECITNTPPQDSEDVKDCGYGGQGTYVYTITTQVLVWRAARSANRLLDLVSGDRDWSEWRDDQKSLGDKAIRDRTIEAFRYLDTDTSDGRPWDHLPTTITGHIRELSIDQWSCDIAVLSFVKDFFFDDENNPIDAWRGTLSCYDIFSRSTIPNTLESFMCYKLVIDPYSREEVREGLEARAYSAGLFAGGAVTPGSHCPYPPAWEIATYILGADHTKLLYPQITRPYIHTIEGQRSRPQQKGFRDHTRLEPAIIGANAGQDGRKRGKWKGFYITTEDRRWVNDPPSYGEWYWFREPLFMRHKPKKFEITSKFIETFLEVKDNWSCFWETGRGKVNFMKNMADMSNYDWGNKQNIVIQPYRNRESNFSHGRGALLGLQKQRDRKVDKKRIIVMGDCMIEHLISLMANLDFHEAGHIRGFLSRLRPMDSREMRFAEQTIMPNNLWITEFNINFITAPSGADVESPLLPNYFPRRRAKFLSMHDVPPPRIMAEAAMGFRIIGDLHDRYWTCYVFYDFGSKELKSDARTQVTQRGYGNSPSQRKCLEGFLICQALDLVLSETKAILDTITKSLGEGKKSQALFNLLLTEEDLRGENYFKTMNKNSVFYPWLREVYITLWSKCRSSSHVAKQWISVESLRDHKPRWSEKDQKSFGDEVAQNQADVKERCAMLEKMEKDLDERIDWITDLKQSLSSELELREARTSTQLGHTVNLFAVLTAIYLPLTFSTSIVAIQDFHWSSPARALVRITLAVTFGTIILLMNLAFLRRNLAALKTWAQRSIRLGMAGAPEPTGSSKKPPYQEKRPAWKYWEKRAHGLCEAEKRSTLLTENAIHDNGSDWWYWYFIAIFIIIVVPVQELTFIIRTLRLQKIKNAGPLKKFVRVPWAPMWILQLVLVYVIMLAGYAFLSLVGLIHRKAVWLWTGDDIAERERAPPEEVEKNLMSELEGDGEILRSGPDSTQKYKGLVGWLMKPAKTMQLLIVVEALQSKREKEFDAEEQGTPVEATEAPPPT
ncbi:hypothetical protein HOY80DRAFT_895359 [Tuber brumale]|nr:hypothetical protein HOY80DRAFT_895359 [Tuber brumale]